MLVRLRRGWVAQVGQSSVVHGARVVADVVVLRRLRPASPVVDGRVGPPVVDWSDEGAEWRRVVVRVEDSCRIATQILHTSSRIRHLLTQAASKCLPRLRFLERERPAGLAGGGGDLGEAVLGD